MSALALFPGDTIQIGGPLANIMKVVRRVRNGWAVLLQGHDVETKLTDDDLIQALVEKKLRYWPINLDNVDERRAQMLKRTFESLSGAEQREVMRRLTYVAEVDVERAKFRNVLDVCDLIIPRIFARDGAEWNQAERDAVRDVAALIRKRDGVEATGEVIKFKQIKPPKASTVRTWYSDWIKNGKDPMALAPFWGDRGRRTPRFEVGVGDEPDAYNLRVQAAQVAYMTPLTSSKAAAYKLYKALCEANNIVRFHSSRSFRRFLKTHYSDYERHVAREGKRSAYLNFGVFDLRRLPDRPLEEVEVDHCLVDLLVVDEDGEIKGRPWITVLLDRATKCIIGLHVSFMSPSYASVQRAVAHSMYPKDLSRFSGLKNSWKAFGRIEWLISDRGKDFLSRNFREACLLLGIYPLALPGRKPWLKGAIERIFRTLHAQVFDLKEGSTKAWDPDHYNAAKRARITRAEFDHMLVKWIVDDYHQEPHPALRRKYGREMSPDQAWDQQTELYRVRFAGDPQLVFRLTGEIFYRQISSIGVHIKTQLYVDKGLFEKLLRRTGGKEKNWCFRRDRFNLGCIWLLDDENPDGVAWHIIPNADPEIAEGASEQQYSLWLDEAKRLAEGEVPTVDMLRQAKARIEERRSKALEGSSKARKALALARYGEVGETFTQVPGFSEYYRSDSGIVRPTAGSIETSQGSSNDDPKPCEQDDELSASADDAPSEELAERFHLDIARAAQLMELV